MHPCLGESRHCGCKEVIEEHPFPRRVLVVVVVLVVPVLLRTVARTPVRTPQT